MRINQLTQTVSGSDQDLRAHFIARRNVQTLDPYPHRVISRVVSGTLSCEDPGDEDLKELMSDAKGG